MIDRDKAIKILVDATYSNLADNELLEALSRITECPDMFGLECDCECTGCKECWKKALKDGAMYE